MRTGFLCKLDRWVGPLFFIALLLLGSHAHAETIWCWGDSLTEGVGVKPSESYPSDLQKIFPNYQVENRGISSQTSQQILARFLASKPSPGDIFIFWMGRNNTQEPEQIEADIATAVARLPEGAKFLVLGIINAAGEVRGTDQYVRIKHINDQLRKTYKAHFVDMEWFLEKQALHDLHMRPTSEDLLDIKSGLPPRSLAVDIVHRNAAGYLAVSHRVAKALQEKFGVQAVN